MGTLFRVTSIGESHGRCVGVVIDGCPAGLKLNLELLAQEMTRRHPGASRLTTSRNEDDAVEVLSGVYDGYTTGAPILMLTWNHDQDSSKYKSIKYTPRPGHGDYPVSIRYGGYNDYRGGGRASGRITAGFVMAGSVAKQLLIKIGIEIHAYTHVIGGVEAPEPDLDWDMTSEENLVRCPDIKTSVEMIKAIDEAKRTGDSIGGEIECVVKGLPAGIGQPVFDTIEGDVAKALYAIPSVKTVEFGRGREFAYLRGSEANDSYTIRDGVISTTTNNCGGILGGITTGAPMILRVVIKPTPSIAKTQTTVDITEGSEVEINIEGRHDPCIVPRAVPVVEAMVAVVLSDHALRRGLISQVIGENK